MFLKTRAEAKCDFITALQWAVNAKNSLSNVHGFSSFHLVFGRNPRLPNVLTDRLLTLQNVSGSELVSTNLKAMEEARKSFITGKSSEKIRRASRHNVRSSSGVKFFLGDSVYCKRNDDKRWRGARQSFGPR